jgi:hypothetical protein
VKLGRVLSQLVIQQHTINSRFFHFMNEVETQDEGKKERMKNANTTPTPQLKSYMYVSHAGYVFLSLDSGS